MEPSAEPILPPLSKRQAGAQLAVVIGVFYGVVYGGAALAGFSSKLENPALSVAMLSSLMLLLVALFSLRDRQWRRSLGLEKRPLPEVLLYGGLGVVFCYGANVVLSVGYSIITKILGGDPEAVARAKAQWADQLGKQVSIAWVLPIAITAGLWEEVAFRGFVLGRLRVVFGSLKPDERDSLAVVLSAALFGLGHGYQGAFGLLQTATIGVVLGQFVLKRKSLWPAVVAHLTIDTIGLFALHVLKPYLEKLTHGQRF